jgi:hypothetical protein
MGRIKTLIAFAPIAYKGYKMLKRHRSRRV